MKIYGYKIQKFLQGFSDAMAYTFVILTLGWKYGPTSWEYAIYPAAYGFTSYTIKRALDLRDKVKNTQ